VFMTNVGPVSITVNTLGIYSNAIVQVMAQMFLVPIYVPASLISHLPLKNVSEAPNGGESG
jgi:hypothetical protein